MKEKNAKLKTKDGRKPEEDEEKEEVLVKGERNQLWSGRPNTNITSFARLPPPITKLFSYIDREGENGGAWHRWGSGISTVFSLLISIYFYFCDVKKTLMAAFLDTSKETERVSQASHRDGLEGQDLFMAYTMLPVVLVQDCAE